MTTMTTNTAVARTPSKDPSSRKHGKTPKSSSLSTTSSKPTFSSAHHYSSLSSPTPIRSLQWRNKDGDVDDWNHHKENHNLPHQPNNKTSHERQRNRKSVGVSPKSFYHADISTTRQQQQPSPTQLDPSPLSPTTTIRSKSRPITITTTTTAASTTNVLKDVVHPHILRQHRGYVTRQQKIQRDVFKSITSLRVWPRQDMAFEHYHQLLQEHLGIRVVVNEAKEEKQVVQNDDGANQNRENKETEGEYGESSSSSSSWSSSCSSASLEHDAKRQTLWNQLATTESPTKMRRQFQEEFLRERAIPKQQPHSPQQHYHNNTHYNFLPALWSLEPRIFAVEASLHTRKGGQRMYLVGHLGRCMDVMWRKADRYQRHYYELIPEQTPCRLYLDLEFSRVTNPHIDSTSCELLMNELLEELLLEFQRIYPSLLLDRRCMVDLDSSTATKFSRHVIVHMPYWSSSEKEAKAAHDAQNEPNNATHTATTAEATTFALFADAAAVGRFVKVWIGRLAEELATGILAKRRPVLAKHLFVNPPPPPTTTSSSSSTQKPTQTTASHADQQILNPTATATCVKELDGNDNDLPQSATWTTMTEDSSHVVPTSESQTSNPPSQEVIAEYAPSQGSTSSSSGRGPTCLVDLGVYSRNRLFRCMGSSKYGKPASAALRIADANQFSFPGHFGNDKFYVPAMPGPTTTRVHPDGAAAAAGDDLDAAMAQFRLAMDWTAHADALAQTLVVPMNSTKVYHTILPESDQAKDLLIHGSNNLAHVRKVIMGRYGIEQPQQHVLRPSLAAGGGGGGDGNGTDKLILERRGSSPFPLLDEYCRSVLGTRGGVQGEIRSWSIQYQSQRLPTGSSSSSSHPRPCDHNKEGDSRRYVATSITYQMIRNRWCEAIGRAHRSNNIMWTIDFRTYQCIQSCHDPDCRMMRFSKTPVNLPEELQTHIAMELQSEVATATNNNNRHDDDQGGDNNNKFNAADDDDDDAEFEKALLALNLNDPMMGTITTRDKLERDADHRPVVDRVPDAVPITHQEKTKNEDPIALADDALLQAILSDPNLFP